MKDQDARRTVLTGKPAGARHWAERGSIARTDASTSHLSVESKNRLTCPSRWHTEFVARRKEQQNAFAANISFVLAAVV